MRKILAVIMTLLVLAGGFLLIAAGMAAWESLTTSRSHWEAFWQLIIPAVIILGIGFALGEATKEEKTTSSSGQGSETPNQTGQTSFAGYATKALAQMLQSTENGRLGGRNLTATDGMLHSYEDAGVDWNRLWSDASRRNSGVSPFGASPYWVRSRSGEPFPLTVLAFWGTSERLRVARDSATERSILAILVDDPDLSVRTAALNSHRY